MGGCYLESPSRDRGSTLLPELLRGSGGRKYLAGFTTRDYPLARGYGTWTRFIGRRVGAAGFPAALLIAISANKVA
mgnify:CR=1 FL=1